MCHHCEHEHSDALTVAEREDAQLTRQWADRRGVPWGEARYFREASLRAHEGLHAFLGSPWLHLDITRDGMVDAATVQRAWNAAHVRKDGTCVQSSDVRLSPRFGASVWGAKTAGATYESDAARHSMFFETWYVVPGADHDCMVSVYATQPACTVRQGQRVMRAVLPAVRSWEHSNPATVEVWERFSEKMGAVWGAPEVWGVSILSAPAAFLQLGHYGEGGSCYAVGGCYSRATLSLALHPRTFVALFYRGAYDTPAYGPRVAQPCGRLWGAMGDSDHPGMVASNLYRLPWATVTPLLASVVGRIFNVAPDSVVMHDRAPHSALAPDGECEDAVYFNGDGHTYAAGDRARLWSFLSSCYADEDHGDYAGRRCARCGGPCDEDNGWTCEDCDAWVCSDCGWSDGWGFHCFDCAQPAECDDCGRTMTEDDACECEHCGRTLCDDCARRCEGCGHTLCSICGEECSVCGDVVCEDCATLCEECGAQHCEGCGCECEGCGARVCNDCECEHRADTCPQASLEGVA